MARNCGDEAPRYFRTTGECFEPGTPVGLPQAAFHGKGWRFQMTRSTHGFGPSNERRGRQRFPIDAPLTVILGERRISAFTRDLSNQGAYFYVAQDDGALIGGETGFGGEVEFVVELPPEITLSTCCLIRCRGRAVRTESTASDLTGVAVAILEYSILREPAAVA